MNKKSMKITCETCNKTYGVHYYPDHTCNGIKLKKNFRIFIDGRPIGHKLAEFEARKIVKHTKRIVFNCVEARQV